MNMASLAHVRLYWNELSSRVFTWRVSVYVERSLMSRLCRQQTARQLTSVSLCQFSNYWSSSSARTDHSRSRLSQTPRLSPRVSLKTRHQPISGNLKPLPATSVRAALRGPWLSSVFLLFHLSIDSSRQAALALNRMYIYCLFGHFEVERI